MTIWHIFIPIVILLSAITKDRFIHFAWAITFFALALIIFSYIKKSRRNKNIFINFWLYSCQPKGISKFHSVMMSFFVLFLSSWLPDIDWIFYSHRNPITHSIIPFVLMFWIIKICKFGNNEWNKLLLIIFGYGLGSHLLTDILPGGNVVWLPAYIDMPFLFFNGWGCIKISNKLISKQLNSKIDSQIPY